MSKRRGATSPRLSSAVVLPMLKSILQLRCCLVSSCKGRVPSAFVVGALLVVFFSLLVVGRRGSLLPGSTSYERIAGEFLSGDLHSTYRPPLYPLLLAVTSLSPQVTTLRCATHVAMILALLAVVLAIVRLLHHDRKTVWVGTILFSTHLLLLLELLSLRETLVYLLAQASFFLILLRGTGNIRMLGLGAIAGLAHLTRPTGVLLLIVAVYQAIRERSATGLCSALIVFGITILPWQLYLKGETGRAQVASSTTSGMNLIKGNNPYFWSYFPWIDVDQYEEALSREFGEHLDNDDVDQKMGTAAKSYLRREPISAAVSFFEKALLVYSPIPIPLGSGRLVWNDGDVAVEQFRWRNLPLMIYGTLHALVLFSGVVLALKRAKIGEHLEPFLVYALLVTAVHSLTFPELRFRLILDLLFLPISAYGWSGVLERERDLGYRLKRW